MIVLSPWQAFAAAAIAFAIAAIVMNRGDPYFFNLRAQDEPILIALAVFVFFGLGGVIVKGAAVLAIVMAILNRYTNLLVID